MSLDGVHAVVTGSGAGIGRACAVRLAGDGADVTVMDVDEAGLAETAALVEETGRRCLPVAVDLLDRAAIVDSFARAKAELGPVGVLHSNAGGGAGVEVRTFAKSTPEQWDAMSALNLTQNIDCARQVIGDMIEARWGRIIVTSSEMAFRTGFGMADYSASKAGLLGFVRNLAHEVGRYEVTVNAVCPGATRTQLSDSMSDEHRQQVVQQIPLGRYGEPDEIAHAVSFLASRGASYVTGESLMVTGGRTMH